MVVIDVAWPVTALVGVAAPDISGRPEEIWIGVMVVAKPRIGGGHQSVQVGGRRNLPGRQGAVWRLIQRPAAAAGREDASRRGQK